MKMIIAIIENQLSDATSAALIANDFRITRLASTGGFLREGATTLMIGVQDDELEKALDLIRQQTPPVQGKTQATIYVIKAKSFKRV